MRIGISIISLLCILQLTALPVHATKIYKWIDKQGNVHYTQRPPTNYKYQQLKLKIHHSQPDNTNTSTQNKTTQHANNIAAGLERQMKQKRLADKRKAAPLSPLYRRELKMLIARNKHILKLCKQYKEIGYEHYYDYAGTTTHMGRGYYSKTRSYLPQYLDECQHHQAEIKDRLAKEEERLNQSSDQ